MIQDCDPLVTVTREFGAFRLSALEGGGACTCRAVGSNSGLLASSVGAPSVVTRLRCDSSSRASSSSVATQALSQDALPALMPEDVGSGLSPTSHRPHITPHTRMAGRDSSRSRRTARRLKARLPMLLRSPLGDRDVVAAQALRSLQSPRRLHAYLTTCKYCDFLFPSCVCVSVVRRDSVRRDAPVAPRPPPGGTWAPRVGMSGQDARSSRACACTAPGMTYDTHRTRRGTFRHSLPNAISG